MINPNRTTKETLRPPISPGRYKARRVLASVVVGATLGAGIGGAGVAAVEGGKAIGDAIEQESKNPRPDVVGGNTYVVQPGDNPATIAERFTPSGGNTLPLQDSIKDEAMHDKTPGVVDAGDIVHVGTYKPPVEQKIK